MTQSHNDSANGRSVELAAIDRHELLESERRRHVVDVLADRPADVELEELARAVAARTGGDDDLDPDAVERIATTLHHVHLPAMDDLDVLEYDPHSHRIVPDEHAIDKLLSGG